jgi:hypothetical protein
MPLVKRTLNYVTTQNIWGFFCHPSDDKLRSRCGEIVEGSKEIMSRYQGAQEISGADPLGYLTDSLYSIFNEYYLKGFDILNVSSQEKIRQLRLLGEALAKKIVEQLPENLQTQAAIALVDVDDNEKYIVYFQSRFQALVTVEFLKTELAVYYDAQIKKPAPAAVQMTQQKNNLFSPPVGSPVHQLLHYHSNNSSRSQLR